MKPGEVPQIPAESHSSRGHLPSLLIALLIMLAGTLYPLLFANSKAQADHGLALALFVAMSVGFVRGVGFIPVKPVWRWLFSGWTCLLALLVAAILKTLH